MYCHNCGPKRIPIRGKVTLGNGITVTWLRFIPETFADAEAEAIRLVTAQHIHVLRCWVTH